MSPMSASRVPAGVPTGGRFAASTRPETEVALDASSADTDTVERPVTDLSNGDRVRFEDGSESVITSIDGDHKSRSIEFDHDPTTIASYDFEETFQVIEGSPVADRHGASDLYPNGRCPACGSGLDEAGRCYQSECTAFDAESPYAGYDEDETE